MKKLAIILMATAFFAATDAYAFSLFNKGEPEAAAPAEAETAAPVVTPAAEQAAPVVEAVKAEINKDAAVKDVMPAVSPEAVPPVSMESDAMSGKKPPEVDPVLKKIGELQQDHFDQMRKNEAKFVEKRNELWEEYRKKVEKENPKKLQEYIKQCEVQAVERYANENNMNALAPMYMGR